MKTTNSKTMFAFTGAILLCTAALLSPSAPLTAFAFEQVQGQDKTGKNCERVDTAGSSTFGKCESVCKGKDVTRDAPNNRWVCKASKLVVGRPPVQGAPSDAKSEQASSTSSPDQQGGSETKTRKAKKAKKQ
jgi:hypothetical protein